MSCVWILQRGHSGDGCVLASTLCKYDLRKRDLFVLLLLVRLITRISQPAELSQLSSLVLLSSHTASDVTSS